VADTGSPRFVRAEEIAVGQYACLTRHALASGCGSDLARPEANGRRTLNLPSRIDDDLAWWLGATVGDGSYRDTRDGTVDLTNQDPEVLGEYRRILTKYGLKVGTYRHPQKTATRLYVVSKAFRGWLSSLGLDYATARRKRVPDVVLRGPTSSRAAFLRGLFDTDGSASDARQRSCRLVTASRRLAEDVQQLLLSLGIVSYVSRQGEWAYCVGVSGTALRHFAEQVGFTVGYKRDRLQAALSRVVRPRTTNIDRIPFSRVLVQDVAAGLRAHWGRSKGVKGVPVPERMQSALATDYFYDEIVDVRVTGEMAEMYDLEVEGVHSFVSNGFICHNSQGNEFAAVVLVAMTTHALALNRTLLYTALTRARRLAVVVGQEKAFEMGIDNWRFTRRVTALGHLLVDAGTAARTRDAEGTTAADEDPAEWEPFYADDEDALWDALARADGAGPPQAP
jgi:replicative DNA helicase Mcm